MIKDEKSLQLAKAAGIEIKRSRKIDDKSLITRYNHVLANGEKLPENINRVKEKVEIELSSNERLSLADNMSKENKEITDLEELERIKDYYYKNNKFPEGIGRKYRNPDAMMGEYYIYDNEYTYYEMKNVYYEDVYLSNEEMSFRMEIMNVKSFKSIASSLLFFKSLTIFIIILYIISFILLISFL